jgi:malate dehydrogenase
MKVSIIGAGNVGTTAAIILAKKELVREVVLLDIKPGIAEGKALDLFHMAPINNYDTKFVGVTDDYTATANSNVIVITSGIPRQPGMSRDDLISVNAGIVKTVTEKAIQYSPNATIIIVSNPLDVMTYTAYLSAKIDPKRIVGMAGILDTARFRAFLSDAIGCSHRDITTVILGGHGDTMVLLPRYTNVAGIPITQLLSKDKIDAIVKRTKNGGGELVALMGTSASYAPGAAVAQMVEAITRDQKRIFQCCAMLNGEYGMKDIFIGVPVKLGKNGIEQVIELELNDEERSLFEASAKSVKSVMDVLDKMKMFD